MKRFLAGIAALAALVALCVGTPLALLQWGAVDFGGLATPWVPDDGRLLVSIATLIGWTCWLATLVEVASQLAHGLSRGRFTWRPPSGAWIRPLVSLLVAAVMSMGIARTSIAAPVPSTAPAAVAQVTALAPQAPVNAQPPAQPTMSHTVTAGDDLWSLAEQHLGDGTRWREIAALNPGVGDHVLQPGQKLLIPATSNFVMVTVAPGDSLWKLAEMHLGDGERWPEIHQANTHLITDPDEIEPGWVLKVPPRLTADNGSSQAVGDHVVARQQSTNRPRAATDQELPSPGATTSATPAPSPQAPSRAAASSQLDPVREVAGSLALAAAAGIVAALTLRRRQQLASRPLGRRVDHPNAAAAEWAAAAAGLADQAPPIPEGGPLRVVVGEGRSGTELIDLDQLQVLSVVGEHRVESLGAMITSLACAEWSQGVELVVVGADLAWAQALDCAGLTRADDADSAIARWKATVAHRHDGEASEDDSAPEVYFFGDELTTAQVDDLLRHRHPKMRAVVAQPCGSADDTLTVAETKAVLASSEESFTPQLVAEPARRALIELFTTATSAATTAAPWWHHPIEGVEEPTPLRVKERPVIVTDQEGEIVTDTPKLLLLGPINLLGAQGPLPPRAIKQCIEYCAWIHEHPGLNSAAMVAGLLVAETTRRSNTSRLRQWLGDDPMGKPFLPEAYTGRLALHPDVTSDWEQFQLKLTGGVNRVSSQSLVDALSMVRGAPLADAAPGQWHWAEELRSDMISTIRDVGVELGRRALDLNDLDTARWAVNRALQAAPEDELLMGVRIRCEFVAGDKAQVDRLVLALTRHARLVGVDLQDETVTLLQEVVEGQARSRRA